MKNVVITGSTRGLGFCMAKEFLKEGCCVTFSGRGEKPSESLKEVIDRNEGRAMYVSCDVRSNPSVEDLWAASSEKWGRIDIWINNAGINYPNDYIYNTDPGYIDSLIDTNIKGMVYGSQTAARKMKEQGGGQIWNMEGLGSNNMTVPKTILYGTSKRALTYFTKGLAKELADTSVRAGRLSPGMMATDFILKQPGGNGAMDGSFKRIFNILGDRPETVAAFLVPRMLKNEKNNAHIVWLTTMKTLMRFASSAFRKRKIV